MEHPQVERSLLETVAQQAAKWWLPDNNDNTFDNAASTSPAAFNELLGKFEQRSGQLREVEGSVMR